MNPEEREHPAKQGLTERGLAEQALAEQWLNEAIDRYQAAPPRLGLETRILAGLQAHAEQRQRRWFFALAASAAAVLCAVLVVTVLNSRRNAIQPAVEVHAADPVKAVKAQRQPANIQRAQQRRAAANKNPSGNLEKIETELQAADVKQDMFPAASPSSEQKTLLQAYLRQTPKQELALLADRQRLASAVPALTIEPIEIKELTPIQDLEPKGNL